MNNSDWLFFLLFGFGMVICELIDIRNSLNKIIELIEISVPTHMYRESRDSIIKVIFGFSALLFVASLPWCLATIPFSSDVTVFPVSFAKEKGTVAQDRMVFTVFPERQEVIRTMLGAENQMVKWLECVVRNKQNWSCSEFLTERTMADGNYRENPSNAVSYTNGWKWWFVRFKNYLSPVPEWITWLPAILIFGSVIGLFLRSVVQGYLQNMNKI